MTGIRTLPSRGQHARRSLNAQGCPPVELAHVVLYSLDPPRMLDWYNTVLMGRTALMDPQGGMMSFDHEHHRIAANHPPDLIERAPGRRVGLNHLAYSYGSLEQLLNNYLRLRQLDIVPTRMMNHGITVSFYYEDPDGNTVELLVDHDPQSKANTNAWLDKPEFQKNPFGYRLDPDQFVADYLAGVPIEELIRRPDL